MAHKKFDKPKWLGADLEDPTQSQGSEPQNAQPDEPPSPGVLPDGYKWKIFQPGVSSNEVASEVSSFIKKYHLQDQSILVEVEYSKEFLQWSLLPPGFSWLIGVEDESTKELVAFIAAVPRNIRLFKKDMLMAEVKCLYILEKPKSLGVQEILLEEMARIVTMKRAKLAYGTPDDFPTVPLATCQYWIRPLNVEKLIDLKIITLGEGITVETVLKINSLPTSLRTKGLRKMEVKDIPSLTTLLQSYMSKIAAAPVFTEDEVEHWFLPRANIVESYVAEESKEIIHFIIFYILPFSTKGVKDSTINVACSLYNLSTKVLPDEILEDAIWYLQSLMVWIFSKFLTSWTTLIWF